MPCLSTNNICRGYFLPDFLLLLWSLHGLHIHLEEHQSLVGESWLLAVADVGSQSTSRLGCEGNRPNHQRHLSVPVLPN